METSKSSLVYWFYEAEFWTQFRDRIKQSSAQLRSRKPKARHYYSNPIGKGGFHISFVNLFKEDTLYLDLIIEDNEEAFLELKSEEETIEQELGCEVEWEEPRETQSGNMRSNIRVVRHADLANREEWEEYLDWLLEYGDRFHDVFRHRIQQL